MDNPKGVPWDPGDREGHISNDAYKVKEKLNFINLYQHSSSILQNESLWKGAKT